MANCEWNLCLNIDQSLFEHFLQVIQILRLLLRNCPLLDCLQILQSFLQNSSHVHVLIQIVIILICLLNFLVYNSLDFQLVLPNLWVIIKLLLILLLLLYHSILTEIHLCLHLEIKLCTNLMVVMLSVCPLLLMSVGLHNQLLLHTLSTNFLGQVQENNKILDDTSINQKVPLLLPKFD